jgi:ADP-ribose pyrophosphatase YjhB (NUDIX family)
MSWAREIQSLAQTGLHYASDEYHLSRYTRLAEIAAEIFTQYSTLEYSETLQLFMAQSGYATPRVDVRAAIFQADQILLVRERSDGGWTLPGGWADVGDRPAQAAEREALEESGMIVAARRLVGVYDANRTGPLEIFHAFKIVFLCELLGGNLSPSSETSEARFFAQDDIPTVLSGERTRARHLEDAFALYHNPSLPAVFD